MDNHHCVVVVNVARVLHPELGQGPCRPCHPYRGIRCRNGNSINRIKAWAETRQHSRPLEKGQNKSFLFLRFIFFVFVFYFILNRMAWMSNFLSWQSHSSGTEPFVQMTILRSFWIDCNMRPLQTIASQGLCFAGPRTNFWEIETFARTLPFNSNDNNNKNKKKNKNKNKQDNRFSW